MSTHEAALALEWIISTLSNDATLQGYAPGGIWRGDAPPGTATPYVAVLYKPQQSKDVMVFKGRAYAELYFEVFAAGPGADDATIANAAAQIDTLLLVTESTAVTGGAIISSYRTAPVESDLLITGEVWTNIGNEQMIRCKSS